MMSGEDLVVVVVELDREGQVLPVSSECLRTGRTLATMRGGTVSCLLMGTSLSSAAEELSRYPLDTVYVVDHHLLETYHPDVHVAAFLQVYEQLKPAAILMADSLVSIDFAPRIAVSLNAGLIMDCVGIELNEGEVVFIKPVYSGNIMAAYTFANEPWIATMRPRVEEPLEKNDRAVARISHVSVELDRSMMSLELIRSIEEPDEGPKLAHADVVVAGGRGIGSPEGFTKLKELAAVLHAAVAASRPPCDLGWVHPKAQVGQTGEKVRPSVYIAVGISGTTQHLTGMASSKTIVAINKDPGANIFRVADYGAVGPYEEIVPAFKEALSEMRR